MTNNIPHSAIRTLDVCADDEQRACLAAGRQAHHAACVDETRDAAEVAALEREAARFDAGSDHVDAQPLGDEQWAYYADEVSRWYVVDAEALTELGALIEHADPDNAYSHWCAGSPGREMPNGWAPDHCATDAHRTYTIFDADPASSSGTAWDTHTDVEIDDDLSPADAAEHVMGILASEAAGLDAEEYRPGDRLYALVYDLDGSVTQFEHEITAEDLGVDDEDAAEDDDDADDEGVAS